MRTRDISDRLSRHWQGRWGEVLRFGVVGVTATAIQYGVYWLLLAVAVPTLAMTVAYGVSFASIFTPPPALRSAWRPAPSEERDLRSRMW